jgi:hypothetical protein
MAAMGQDESPAMAYRLRQKQLWAVVRGGINREGMGWLMETIKITSVLEPELDMNRCTSRPEGKVRRLLGSLLGYPQNLYSIGKPRRSIDREHQQYAPLSE